MAGPAEFGSALLDGYVAFSLSANADESTGADAAYVVVSDMFGNIQNVRVSKVRGEQGFRERFESCKMWNASTLILAEFFTNSDTVSAGMHL